MASSGKSCNQADVCHKSLSCQYHGNTCQILNHVKQQY